MEVVKQISKAHQQRPAASAAGRKGIAMAAPVGMKALAAGPGAVAKAAPGAAGKAPSGVKAASVTKAPSAGKSGAGAKAVPVVKALPALGKAAPGAGAGLPEKVAPGATEAAGSSGKEGAKSSASMMEADKRFQAVRHTIKADATRVKKNEGGAKKAADAQSAAKGPDNEKMSSAKDKQSDAMDQQQPGVFDAEKFKAALKEKISSLKLDTLKDADEFKENDGAAAVKGDVTAQVGAQKEAATGGVSDTVKQEPDPAKEQAKEAGPAPVMAAGVATTAVNGQAAAPKPVADTDISLKQGSQELDNQLAGAKVTEKQLTKSNEPGFAQAVQSKNAAQKDSAEQPVQFRKTESGILGQSQAATAGFADAHMNGMTAGRNQNMTQVLDKQTTAKSKDEENRKKVADAIGQKFDATKKDVEDILAKLDTDVNKTFDDGIADATKQFENYVDKGVSDFKDERYSGITGKAKWVVDKLTSLPDEVNAIYKKGKELYVTCMDGVISQVAKIVADGLNAAKKRINAGKQEIKAYVTSLPKDLQGIGQDAAKDIGSKFSELESSVDNKENELVDSLAAKYKAGMEAVDKKIEEMKEANKGWISKAKDAIMGVINTIIALKNMLLNVLARAASAIELIIEDPIGFLGNLVAGVKMGIKNYLANIVGHLKEGLMGWLFGALANAGIEMPKSFDLKGILSLILQVLGLTYANIRSRAVNIVGEKVVGVLEKAAEIFILIKNEGVGGLWKFIQDKVESLKETVMSSIQEFVITKIITAGITWVLSLLNPASAFIKACKMIYDVIMFFVERGKQILDLVNAVINSVTAIAKGAIGVAAAAVEGALAKALPVAISFLASLLGLDGISEKIKTIIEKIQAPINAAIDWVIHKAVALVKAAGKLLGIGNDKDPEKDKADKEERLEKGLTAAQKAVDRFAGKPVGKMVLTPLLFGIKTLYRMQVLEVVEEGNFWAVYGEVNPKGKKTTGAYREVAGHHIHQSAADGTGTGKGTNPNHNDAIAIAQKDNPGFTEDQHKMASRTQRNMNRAAWGKGYSNPTAGSVTVTSTGDGTLAPTGSMAFEDLKAYYSLMAAGKTSDEAYALTTQSRAQLESQNISPVRVPKF